VVDATWSETSLDDFKATALSKDHVALVHTDIREGDVTVAVGRIIKAHDRKHAVDGNTRSVCGDEDD